MIDARVFDELSRTLGKLLPPGVSELRQDFERNSKAAIQSALGSLDLVTREEFDVQTLVLRKTRQQLELMESRINILEAAAKSDGELPAGQ